MSKYSIAFGLGSFAHLQSRKTAIKRYANDVVGVGGIAQQHNNVFVVEVDEKALDVLLLKRKVRIHRTVPVPLYLFDVKNEITEGLNEVMYCTDTEVRLVVSDSVYIEVFGTMVNVDNAVFSIHVLLASMENKTIEYGLWRYDCVACSTKLIVNNHFLFSGRVSALILDSELGAEQRTNELRTAKDDSLFDSVEDKEANSNEEVARCNDAFFSCSTDESFCASAFLSDQTVLEAENEEREEADQCFEDFLQKNGISLPDEETSMYDDSHTGLNKTSVGTEKDRLNLYEELNELMDELNNESFAQQNAHRESLERKNILFNTERKNILFDTEGKTSFELERKTQTSYAGTESRRMIKTQKEQLNAGSYEPSEATLFNFRPFLDKKNEMQRLFCEKRTKSLFCHAPGQLYCREPGEYAQKLCLHPVQLKMIMLFSYVELSLLLEKYGCYIETEVQSITIFGHVKTNVDECMRNVSLLKDCFQELTLSIVDSPLTQRIKDSLLSYENIILLDEMNIKIRTLTVYANIDVLRRILRFIDSLVSPVIPLVELRLCYYKDSALFDFIVGKKHGKVNKIRQSCLIQLTIEIKEPLLAIEISGTAKEIEKVSLLVEGEFPEEDAFYVPDRFHKSIIGKGGKNIQRIMKRYNVYVKFLTQHESEAYGGRYNVITRTPRKNASALEKIREEILVSTRCMKVQEEMHTLNAFLVYDPPEKMSYAYTTVRTCIGTARMNCAVVMVTKEDRERFELYLIERNVRYVAATVKRWHLIEIAEEQRKTQLRRIFSQFRSVKYCL